MNTIIWLLVAGATLGLFAVVVGAALHAWIKGIK